MTADLHLHATFAYTEDGVRCRVTEWIAWPQAIDAWYTLDDARRAGLGEPGVRFYAVRAVNDPEWAAAQVGLPDRPALGPPAPRKARVLKGDPPLRQEGPGVYVTLDGQYRVERQDGWTECEHPLCYDLHRRFHEPIGARATGGWQHVVSYVAWHVWDVERDDYAGERGPMEYASLAKAREALGHHLRDEVS